LHLARPIRLCLVKAADHLFGKITMKPTHVLATILATGFGILWCFMIWSSGQWPKTTLQGEGSGSFYEEKKRRADAQAFAREAFNDTPPPLQRETFNNTPPPIQSEDFMREAANKSPVPVNDATSVSGSSWEDQLGKRIDHWVRVIKSIGHRTRGAATDVYFTLTYISVRNPSGITGVSAGTRVVCVKDEGPVLLVKAGNLEFEVRRQYLTDDLDVARLAVRDDAEAQQEVASIIAKQERAIDQQGDKRKLQPSGQH
jgi:hypothetical protein